MKFKILPIAGDASFRTFYRLALNKTSKIIVLAKKEKYKNLIAYSAVNKFLRTNKIFAPNTKSKRTNQTLSSLVNYSVIGDSQLILYWSAGDRTW